MFLSLLLLANFFVEILRRLLTVSFNTARRLLDFFSNLAQTQKAYIDELPIILYTYSVIFI